jgi:1A family penicillin-binding protein
MNLFSSLKKKNPILFWVGAGIAGIIALCAVFYLYIAYLLPLPDIFLNYDNLPTSKIYDRNGVLLYEVLRPELGKNSFVSLDKMPKKFIEATLAAEDINYYSHPGVDFFAIIRAVILNVEQQKIVSGGSTITQQLIRNMLGITNTRNFSAKAMEAIYAVRLNNVYSKDRILELYLNRIYYGNLSYGAQTAALNFFGKNIYDLDLAQLSFLAGLPQSPSGYNPYVYFEKAKNRQKYVLDQMVKNNFISTEDADSAVNEPVYLHSAKIGIKAPHFVHYVMNQIEDEYGSDFLIKGGVEIYTTLDYNLQLKAERIITQQVNFLTRNNVTNGALIALDVKTAQILSWVGSADYFDKEINGAVDMVNALRQPGSSIKPLTYLLAFEKGYTPATILNDIPTQFDTATGPYSPKNYDLDYHGPVRVRTALASSYNIPAVKTLDFVGVENFIGFLRKLGIDTLDRPADFYGLALTLGGGEVRLIDMAAAFNVIANYGVKKEPSAILRIKNSKGEIIYDLNSAANAVPDEYVLGPQGREHAYQIIDIIKDPLARIPGFGEQSVLEISHEAAVKTGTTRNFRDNWTIGFTPQLLTAVWVGNADASPMENISGVDGAAPIWADFMESSLANQPKEKFIKPENLVDVELCAISGKLATDYCHDKITELFVKGTEPKDHDDYYRVYSVDKSTGYAIPQECLSDYDEKYSLENFSQQVILTYPDELLRWATQKGYKPPLIASCNKDGASTNGYPPGYADDNAEAGVISVKIDNPVNNDVYLITDSIPLQDQKVPFRVTVPLNAIEVSYYIDEKKVTVEKEFPFTYLWLPAKGRHILRAEARNTEGKISSASVSFEVN